MAHLYHPPSSRIIARLGQALERADVGAAEPRRKLALELGARRELELHDLLAPPSVHDAQRRNETQREAARRARTSFFQIEAVAPDQPELRLRDLLAPDQPDVWVTDLGLSDSFRAGGWLALFCRLLTVRDITMTSGFSFGFATKFSPGILQAYRQKTKRVPPAQLAEARFVFFYRKHRQCGIEQTYQKVV